MAHLGFECVSCKGRHEKQAFISHARNDAEGAYRLKLACCEVGVAPYLFEFSPEFRAQEDPSDSIACQVAASSFLFVLLGESVSRAYWTQAWIGFELGIARGFAIATNLPKNVIVLQDTRQGTKVSVPMLDELFLFDFASVEGWDQCQGLVLVLARLASDGEFYKAANRFRSSTMKADVKCECRSEYEAWIAIQSADKLGNGCNWLRKSPERLSECTIECPSCNKMVTRVFRQMFPS